MLHMRGFPSELLSGSHESLTIAFAYLRSWIHSLDAAQVDAVGSTMPTSIRRVVLQLLGQAHAQPELRPPARKALRKLLSSTQWMADYSASEDQACGSAQASLCMEPASQESCQNSANTFRKKESCQFRASRFTPRSPCNPQEMPTPSDAQSHGALAHPAYAKLRTPLIPPMPRSWSNMQSSMPLEEVCNQVKIGWSEEPDLEELHTSSVRMLTSLFDNGQEADDEKAAAQNL